jgi:hypothetical protein
MHVHTNLGTLAAHQTNHLSVRRTRAKLGKTAIRIVISGAVFAGVSLTAWNRLQAEFESGFREFSACPEVAPDDTTLHDDGPYRGKK